MQLSMKRFTLPHEIFKVLNWREKSDARGGTARYSISPFAPDSAVAIEGMWK